MAQETSLANNDNAILAMLTNLNGEMKGMREDQRANANEIKAIREEVAKTRLTGELTAAEVRRIVGNGRPGIIDEIREDFQKHEEKDEERHKDLSDKIEAIERKEESNEHKQELNWTKITTYGSAAMLAIAAISWFIKTALDAIKVFK